MLLVVVCVLSACGSDKPVRDGFQWVEIAGRDFELELALTSKQRYKGLSGRESIPEDGGMLFVFPDQRERVFVMRDCLVPIDILFLNDAGYVVSSHAMQVEPEATRSNPSVRYPSRYPARYAIEVRGGLVAEMGVKAGDRIELPGESLKAQAR